MHLLGRSITIDVDKGTLQAKRILDVPVYDFDDQGSRALSEPVTLQKGQTLTVTCTTTSRCGTNSPPSGNSRTLCRLG